MKQITACIDASLPWLWSLLPVSQRLQQPLTLLHTLEKVDKNAADLVAALALAAGSICWSSSPSWMLSALSWRLKVVVSCSSLRKSGRKSTALRTVAFSNVMVACRRKCYLLQTIPAFW